MKRNKLAALMTALITDISSVFRREREECWNAASTTKTHATGQVPVLAEVAITTRYLLVQKGTADDGVIINTATTRPLGVMTDEPASGSYGNMALLGSTPGTLRVIAAKSIPAKSKLWTTAGGKVTDTYAAGAFFVGRTINSAGADGDVLEVQHCFPLLDASGTTL